MLDKDSLKKKKKKKKFHRPSEKMLINRPVPKLTPSAFEEQ